jgi:hypothetical protein
MILCPWLPEYQRRFIVRVCGDDGGVGFKTLADAEKFLEWVNNYSCKKGVIERRGLG